MACLAARSATAGPRAYLADQVARGLVDLGVRHDLVHQPDGQRLGGADEPAGEHDVLGPGRADQPGQPLGAAGAGDQAEQDLRLADPARSRRATRKSAHSASSRPPPSA